MTTALYRRYRPDSFADVIGQEHVTDPLRAALRADRATHAYLFSGPRGCGKTTSARILARCLNCAEGPTDTPCGVCPSCVELARGGPGSLDVVEIDAASHGGVDDARDLRERAVFAPARDRYKVFIIDEAHMVTPQGFNALLKLVEEPPAHVKFVFATTEPEKVIGTIRSRTHHYPFRLVPPAVLQAYLGTLCEAEDITVESGVLPLVVRAGGGSVRDSLSVLDQLMAGAADDGVSYHLASALLGFTPVTLLDDAVGALAAGDGAGLFRVVDHVVESGRDPRRFVEDLLDRLRDLILIAASGGEAETVLRALPADEVERMRPQAAALGAHRLSTVADIVNTGLTEMVGATSPRLLLELVLTRAMLAVGGLGEVPVAAPIATVALPRTAPVPSGSPGSAVSSGSAGSAGSVEAPPASRPSAAAQRPPVEPGTIERSRGDGAGVRRPTSPEAPEGRESQRAAREPAAEDTPDENSTTMSSAAGGPVADSAGPAPREAARPAEGARTPEAASSRQTAPPAEPTVTATPTAEESGQGRGGDAGADAEAASTAGAVDGTGLRRRWPEVMQTLAGANRTAWALISQNAQPGEVTADAVTLLFPTPGLISAFTSRDGASILSQAIFETLGLRLRVVVDVAGPDGPGGPGGDRGPGGGAPVNSGARGSATQGSATQSSGTQGSAEHGGQGEPRDGARRGSAPSGFFDEVGPEPVDDPYGDEDPFERRVSVDATNQDQDQAPAAMIREPQSLATQPEPTRSEPAASEPAASEPMKAAVPERVVSDTVARALADWDAEPGSAPVASSTTTPGVNDDDAVADAPHVRTHLRVVADLTPDAAAPREDPPSAVADPAAASPSSTAAAPTSAPTTEPGARPARGERLAPVIDFQARATAQQARAAQDAPPPAPWEDDEEYADAIAGRAGESGPIGPAGATLVAKMLNGVVIDELVDGVSDLGR